MANQFPYNNTGAFYDVTSGSNGTCDSSAPYLCNATAGYDAPTGWGTPNAQAIAAAASATTTTPTAPTADAGS